MRPSEIHFVGHGGFGRNADEGFIALADEEGRTHRLNATQLSRVLADHSSLRLVFLNSCEGGQSGEERHPDWKNGDLEFMCDGPQECPPTPKRGFGKVWCEVDGLRTDLGVVVKCKDEDEYNKYTGPMQQFKDGFMLQAYGGEIYMFYYADEHELDSGHYDIK